MKKLVIISLLLLIQFQIQAQDEKYMALFMYKFVQNLEFPNGKIGNEYVIGVVGSDEVYNQLSQLTSSRKINGKPISVVKFNPGGDVSSLCLLFLSHDNIELFDSLNPDVQNNAAILVGETPGLAKKGAALNFSRAQGRLGFEMNLETIESMGVKTSNTLKLQAMLVN
jgi:hypothetical protein